MTILCPSSTTIICNTENSDSASFFLLLLHFRLSILKTKRELLYSLCFVHWYFGNVPDTTVSELDLATVAAGSAD